MRCEQKISNVQQSEIAQESKIAQESEIAQDNRIEEEKAVIIEMIGITQEQSSNYFIRLNERDRKLDRELNRIHNPEIIYTCLTKAMNGLDINNLPASDLQRLVLGVFYYNT